MLHKKVCMTSLRIVVCAFAVLLGTADIVHAQQRTGWYLDTSASLSPMARVDVYGPQYNTHSFAIVFETRRRCEPMFSMFVFHSRGGIGENRNIRTVGPNHFHVTTDGTQHTWHAVIAEYTNGREIAMGITSELWDSLLEGPKSIAFSDSSQKYAVPTSGLENALTVSMNRCLELL